MLALPELGEHGHSFDAATLLTGWSRATPWGIGTAIWVALGRDAALLAPSKQQAYLARQTRPLAGLEPRKKRFQPALQDMQILTQAQ